ncbi:MAG: LssY C-terminal domain-containing protein [Chthoniobacterales bacterium]
MNGRVVAAAVLLGWTGCAAFVPPTDGGSEFLERAESRSDGGVSVSAAVLTDAEADREFNSPLGRNAVQPVWVEIRNERDEELLVMPIAVDPDYFSPSEAAWRSRRLWERRSREKMKFFTDRQLPMFVPPLSNVSGFVFTNRDPGMKAFTVQLIGDNENHDFEFHQFIPGLRTDLEDARLTLERVATDSRDLSLAELRDYLEELPSTALGGDRRTDGDPLNIVVVGDVAIVLATLARRGWDVTEAIYPGSVVRMVLASVFKSNYRTSPISPLYVFDRSQDFALQKTRGNVDERNHLRLWLAPVTLEGESVWVGQISRDIGVKLSSRTVVTHKIDPDVDDARSFLMQDLLSSGSTRAVGFVSGVGESSEAALRRNFTRDPYLTDGLRVVMILTDEAIGIDEVDWLEWDWPTDH